MNDSDRTELIFADTAVKESGGIYCEHVDTIPEIAERLMLDQHSGDKLSHELIYLPSILV